METCRNCGKKYERGGYASMPSLPHIRLYEYLCEECAEEKDRIENPPCPRCKSRCVAIHQCGNCKEECCTHCGKLFPYYSFTAYVCSEKCYKELLKIHMEGMYPDREFE